MVYVPYAQSVWQGMIVLRTTTELHALVPAIRHDIAHVDSTATWWTARTMDDISPGRSHSRALVHSSSRRSALSL